MSCPFTAPCVRPFRGHSRRFLSAFAPPLPCTHCVTRIQTAFSCALAAGHAQWPRANARLSLQRAPNGHVRLRRLCAAWAAALAVPPAPTPAHCAAALSPPGDFGFGPPCRAASPQTRCRAHAPSVPWPPVTLGDVVAAACGGLTSPYPSQRLLCTVCHHRRASTGPSHPSSPPHGAVSCTALRCVAPTKVVGAQRFGVLFRRLCRRPHTRFHPSAAANALFRGR